MNKYWFLSLLFIAAIVGMFFIKPFRLLVPELHSMHCKDSVCVEDINALNKAETLYKTALAGLEKQGLLLNSNPRFVYCSTDQCYKNFGGENERAISYPFLGTIIAPASWQTYISQHELIHWIQFETLGAIATMQAPEWFREGMAYKFSDAPDTDIPEYYFPLIKQYTTWHAEKSWEDIWQLSKEL